MLGMTALLYDGDGIPFTIESLAGINQLESRFKLSMSSAIPLKEMYYLPLYKSLPLHSTPARLEER